MRTATLNGRARSLSPAPRIDDRQILDQSRSVDRILADWQELRRASPSSIAVCLCPQTRVDRSPNTAESFRIIRLLRDHLSLLPPCLGKTAWAATSSPRKRQKDPHTIRVETPRLPRGNHQAASLRPRARFRPDGADNWLVRTKPALGPRRHLGLRPRFG